MLCKTLFALRLLHVTILICILSVKPSRLVALSWDDHRLPILMSQLYRGVHDDVKTMLPRCATLCLVF